LYLTGEFWDKYSITDYEEYLEPVEFKADIKRRHFQIELDEETFIALWTYSRKQQKSAKQLASIKNVGIMLNQIKRN